MPTEAMAMLPFLNNPHLASAMADSLMMKGATGDSEIDPNAICNCKKSMEKYYSII